jgi:hypothetical protein
MAWQIGIMKTKTKYVIAHNFHLLISLHVMHVQNVQIVKAGIERIADLKLQVNNRIKNPNFLKLNQLDNISHFVFEGFDAV